MSQAESWIGEMVRTPTPVSDLLAARGIAALSCGELAWLPTERLLSQRPAWVVAVQGDVAVVKHDRYGSYRYPLGALERTGEKQQEDDHVA